jgi:Fe-S cluster biogenesis protein NfuA
MSTENKKVPISVYAEMTPNPAVMKFVASVPVNPYDSVEFKNIEEAQISPLAISLFHFPFVKEVFVAKNFVAITKFNIVEWDAIAAQVRLHVQDFFQNGGQVLTADPYAGEKEEQENESAPIIEDNDQGKVPENEIEEKIVQILEEYIKPSVAQDGGDVVFSDYKDGVVKVKLKGACNGCPSATVTLKDGIENLFKQMMPDHVHTVEQEL